MGDRRATAATSARCAPASTSTPATSAACCARSRPTAWSTVGADARRPARAARSPDARRAGGAGALDDRSDELARSMLAPLDPAERQRLVAAMGDVERLLTAALVDDRCSRPRRPAAPGTASPTYFVELDRRFEARLRPGHHAAADDDEMRPPAGVFLVASLRASRSGAAPSSSHGGAPPYIKRMWVADRHAGLGLGRRLLADAGGPRRHSTAHDRRPPGDEPRRSPRRSPCTARRATARSPPSTTSRTRDHWFEKRL